MALKATDPDGRQMTEQCRKHNISNRMGKGMGESHPTPQKYTYCYCRGCADSPRKGLVGTYITSFPKSICRKTTYLDFDKSFCCLDLGFTEGSSILSAHISAHCEIGRLINGLEQKGKQLFFNCWPLAIQLSSSR